MSRRGGAAIRVPSSEREGNDESAGCHADLGWPTDGMGMGGVRCVV